jgi:methionyl-tRNA synthetase
LNYITAIGYGDDQSQFGRWWPAELQLMAKDILWFHAIIWPAMLLSAGLRPPKHVFAHGFFTIEGQKISKSLGNIIRPHQLIERYGADATRYLMLSELPFGVDGDISLSSFTTRYNSDLANDLGNLLNRVVSMLNRYFAGVVPSADGAAVTEADRLLRAAASQALAGLDAGLTGVAFSEGLSALWQFIGRANKYVEESAPWTLAKSDTVRLGVVLYNLAESLRLIAHALWPVMPEAAERMAATLGVALELHTDWPKVTQWGRLAAGVHVEVKSTPLFPKMQ